MFFFFYLVIFGVAFYIKELLYKLYLDKHLGMLMIISLHI